MQTNVAGCKLWTCAWRQKSCWFYVERTCELLDDIDGRRELLSL